MIKLFGGLIKLGVVAVVLLVAVLLLTYEPNTQGVPATTPETIASVEGVDGPTASPLVPGGGLAAHEVSGGHTIARHIGKTDADLAARLVAEPRISGASSFIDREVAERAVSDALQARSADIDGWLSGERRRMPAFEVNVGYDVGRSLLRGATSASTVQRVRIVLERTPAMPTGYKIITAFPTPSP